MSASPDQSLWRAVIMQALTDATMPGLSPETGDRTKARREARTWLTQSNCDFDAVCLMAGEEPWRLRALATKLIADSDAGIDKSAKRAAPASKAAAKTYAFDRKSMTLAEWAAHTGIKKETLQSRLSKGWSFERAITTPIMSLHEAGRLGRKAQRARFSTAKPPKPITEKRGIETWLEWRGESHSIMQWSRITGINHRTIRTRLRKGWSIGRILNEPVAVKRHRGVVDDFGHDGLGPAGVHNVRSDENRVSEVAE